MKNENHQEFLALYNKAHTAGHEAAMNKTPNPVTFQDSISGQKYYETEGLCGFAWIIVRPGTSRFARWLKEQNKARTDSYYGGVCIWVSDYNQSVEKKEAYARAFAEILKDAGYNRVYAMSRLD